MPTCVVCEHQLSTQEVRLHVGPPVVGGAVRSCSHCGTAQISPMPTPDSLSSLYSKDYYESYADGPGIAGGSDDVPPYLRKRLSDLTDRLGRGRILDFGCAEGLFVAYARDQGWKAMGVEVSHWAAEHGRKRYGVEIFETSLEGAPIEATTLNVVHANHVLEHLTDPVATMRAAHRLLRPGGLLVAEVPQELFVPLADSILRRLRPGQPLPPNYHTLYFSRRGLRIAAERAGYEEIEISNVRHVEVLRDRPAPFAMVRGLVYRTERLLQRGPVYVLLAKRP
jgi:SAM-dependent methyltransferase